MSSIFNGDILNENLNIFTNLRMKKFLNKKKFNNFYEMNSFSNFRDSIKKDSIEMKIHKKKSNIFSEFSKRIVLRKSENSNISFYDKKELIVNEKIEIKFESVKNFAFYLPYNNIENILKKKKFHNFVRSSHKNKNKNKIKMNFILIKGVNKIRNSVKIFLKFKRKKKLENKIERNDLKFKYLQENILTNYN